MNRPNILLITTDQQRFDTINALGNRHIYTPHLNWLADTGIAYTRCYSDSPICMAARATIMTGKHGFTTGLTSNGSKQKPLAEHSTLPGVLTNNGYQTRAQGKMHFSPMRANYGFEHMELPMDYYRERNRHVNQGVPKGHGVGENDMEPVISTVDEVNSLTYWTIQRSIDFLETRDETRPFFLWTSFTKPHPPFDPCANYWALYQNKTFPHPARGDWSQTSEQVPQGYMRSTYLLNNAYRMSLDQLQDVKRAYYACITQIDYSLGLLFARMREMNLLENTWIIFTSDHGEMLGDHHMGAKSVFFEGSSHVPLIIRPASGSNAVHSLAGTRCEAVVDLADIMPTLLDIAEVEAQPAMDGANIVRYTDHPAPNRIFYGDCKNQYFAVIENEMKYLWTPLGGAELLFDLHRDPKELCNLSEESEAQETLLALRKRLMNHMSQYHPGMVKEGRLKHTEVWDGPSGLTKSPGFSSTVHPSDMLH